MNEFSELEVKLAADKVDPNKFKNFIQGMEVERFLRVTGPDSYHERDGDVVRYRYDPKEKRSEITVKKRRTENSIRDRLEINLLLDPKMQPKDVDAFLENIGFKKCFTVVKEANIYWVKLTPNLTASFVLYTTWLDDKPKETKSFIEIECESESNVTTETAKRHLRTWTLALQDRFNLGEPLNESLYEIYSGKRYLTVA